MDFIKKLQKLLFEENVNQDFADYKTEDGRIIRTEALAEGNEIKEINEAGEIVDLEDGEYIVVDENIKIVVANSVIESTEEIAVENPEEEMEEDFIDSKLEDGTVIKVDKLEVGGLVEVADADGNYTPAPEGEHILEDGTKVVVDAEGIITEVIAPEADAEEEMSEDVEETFESKIENWFASKLESEEVKSLFQSISKYVEQNEKLISKFEEIEKENKELKEKFHKFSTEDSAESLETKVKFTEMSKEEKVKFLSKR